jgi:hypothetical protein
MGSDGQQVLAPEDWSETIFSTHALKAVPAFREQCRRMSIASHEKIDTAFVVQVAGRYQRSSTA